MTEKKTKLKPSMPRRENLWGVTRRVRQCGDNLIEAKSGRAFSDCAEIIRADRDSSFRCRRVRRCRMTLH